MDNELRTLDPTTLNADGTINMPRYVEVYGQHSAKLLQDMIDKQTEHAIEANLEEYDELDDLPF